MNACSGYIVNYYSTDENIWKVWSNNVTDIKDGAFSECSGLRTVDLPSTLKTIGANAFYECYGISNIKVPASVETIGENAFHSINIVTVTPALTAEGSPWGSKEAADI